MAPANRNPGSWTLGLGLALAAGLVSLASDAAGSSAAKPAPLAGGMIGRSASSLTTKDILAAGCPAWAKVAWALMAAITAMAQKTVRSPAVRIAESPSQWTPSLRASPCLSIATDAHRMNRDHRPRFRLISEPPAQTRDGGAIARAAVRCASECLFGGPPAYWQARHSS